MEELARTKKGYRKMSKPREYHGLSKKDFYGSYCSMIDRCTRPWRRDYKHYGARGIKVCERWLESPANFYADMGDKPFYGAELDRIDPDGNYEPSNCRWISHKENAKNQRRSKKYSTEYVKVKRENLCSNCLINCKVSPV
jgi:hypothetical protein